MVIPTTNNTEKETEDLESFLTTIGQDMDDDEEPELDSNWDFTSFFEDMFDDDTEKFDSFEKYSTYKNFMIEEVEKEVKFKSKVRMISLISLGIIGVLMIFNVLVMLYGPGQQISKGYMIPKFDSKLVMAMITATFVNLFAIITLVFKYVFSPTSELLNHTKEINGD